MRASLPFRCLLIGSVAVDNVLERFVVLNKKAHLLTEDQILRVATDQSKVNKSLQHYTIDARVGGDLNENNKLAKQALARVKSAVIIFTTCAGWYRFVDYDGQCSIQGRLPRRWAGYSAEGRLRDRVGR